MNSSTITVGTWMYCDPQGEESLYPQVIGISSSQDFQATYWKCAVVFLASSLRVNPTANHVLFTNVRRVPDLGEFKTQAFLEEHNIQIVSLPFTYQTPIGYFGAWRNQFYIFDILKYLSDKSGVNDITLILDSDCLWLNPIDRIVADVRKYGLLTYEPIQPLNEVIGSLTRMDMKTLFEELDNQALDSMPLYFGGEWFAATGQEIQNVSAEFESLWANMLQRFSNKQLKFNEEAHVLSYIYHKLGYAACTANPYIRRIWTSPFLYDACKKDLALDIWHLPAEKRYGIKRLFEQVKDPKSPFWRLPLGESFTRYLANYVGVPQRSLSKVLMDTFDDRMSGFARRVSESKKASSTKSFSF